MDNVTYRDIFLYRLDIKTWETLTGFMLQMVVFKPCWMYFILKSKFILWQGVSYCLYMNHILGKPYDVMLGGG